MDFWARPPAERLAAFARLRALDRPVFFRRATAAAGPRRTGLPRARTARRRGRAASRNAKVFSSEPAATSPEPPPWLSLIFGTPMVNMDDPRHARLRRIVSRAFSPRLLARLEQDVERTATRIVDDVVASGAGATSWRRWPPGCPSR